MRSVIFMRPHNPNQATAGSDTQDVLPATQDNNYVQTRCVCGGGVPCLSRRVQAVFRNTTTQVRGTKSPPSLPRHFTKNEKRHPFTMGTLVHVPTKNIWLLLWKSSPTVLQTCSGDPALACCKIFYPEGFEFTLSY